ncbi:hypothetical protein QFZ82_007083 [Streptomyces sp. V4I23]|uniref:hypothetical protein n=1 Tax=Streptomyces sp. V4I23 TaxID=3042282 RepID=UPI002787ABA9|nr:hypothetical protein [Streptomyces sp. V4I23]MDQ1012598.1 hypothetical protein [Streptomyces sp. V4I23]
MTVMSLGPSPARRDAWRGKGCCAAPAAVTAPAAGEVDADACGCRPGCACRAPVKEVRR